MTRFKTLWMPLVNWLEQFVPNPNFLPVAATFAIAMLAFFFPLTIDIVSRLTTRYDSNIVTQCFLEQLKNKKLHLYLLIFALSTITLYFFAQEYHESKAYQLVAWVILGTLFFIARLIYQVINSFMKIVSDPSLLLHHLYESIDKIINNKSINNKQEDLIRYLEGIGDILTTETKAEKKKILIVGLQEITDCIKELLALEKNHSAFLRNRKDHEDDNFFDCIMTANNQLIRIYEVAINIQNQEIAKRTFLRIDEVIKQLCIEQHKKIVENILGTVFSITQEAVRLNYYLTNKVIENYVVLGCPYVKGIVNLVYLYIIHSVSERRGIHYARRVLPKVFS